MFWWRSSAHFGNSNSSLSCTLSGDLSVRSAFKATYKEFYQQNRAIMSTKFLSLIAVTLIALLFHYECMDIEELSAVCNIESNNEIATFCLGEVYEDGVTNPSCTPNLIQRCMELLKLQATYEMVPGVYKRRSFMGKRRSFMGKRRSFMGKRRSFMGKRYTFGWKTLIGLI